MKLIIVAALIAACAAGRLEHLERSYLPPDSSNSLGHNGFGSNGHGSFGSSNGGSHGSFGSNGGSHGGSNGGFGSNGGSHGGFGSNGASHGSFGSNGGSNGGFGSNGASHSSSGFGSNGGSHGFGSTGNGFGSSNGNGFGAATSNQYLPPNHGSSASIGVARNGQSSFGVPSTQYGTPAFGSNNGFGSQGPSAQYQRPSGASSQSQFGLSNQYLTPKQSSNFQNIPQQSFDEQTGYHY